MINDVIIKEWENESEEKREDSLVSIFVFYGKKKEGSNKHESEMSIIIIGKKNQTNEHCSPHKSTHFGQWFSVTQKSSYHRLFFLFIYLLFLLILALVCSITITT